MTYREHDGNHCWCKPELVPVTRDDGSEAYGIRHHYEGHRCACEHCGTEYPSRDDADFDAGRDPLDDRWANQILHWPTQILLDGVPAREVMAAKAGDPGWVIAISYLPGQPLPTGRGPTRGHVCGTCFEDVCSYARSGEVRILTAEAVAS